MNSIYSYRLLFYFFDHIYSVTIFRPTTFLKRNQNFTHYIFITMPERYNVPYGTYVRQMTSPYLAIQRDPTKCSCSIPVCFLVTNSSQITALRFFTVHGVRTPMPLAIVFLPVPTCTFFLEPKKDNCHENGDE